MPQATVVSPELVDLFTTYTASPDSIGAHLAQATARETEHDPLLVVTGTDLALYPGGGAAPAIEPYRLATRGFKELAGISHLGPAVATLARLRELADEKKDQKDQKVEEGDDWRADAARLLDVTKAARAASSVTLWRDQLAVAAFAGREERIAALVDYSCLLTERFLERALAQVLWLAPALVLLDEPAAGISPALSHRLAGIIRRLRAEGVGVLLVEHDVAFLASLSDRVYVMANGKIIAVGTVAEVSADPAVVDAYLGDQVALAVGSSLTVANALSVGNTGESAS